MKQILNKPVAAYIHPSEMRLFRYIADGRTVAEVADDHGLPPKVVHGAVKVVLRFLGAKDVDEALRMIERAMAEPDTLDREIDFSNGKRGLHYDAVRASSNIVKLDPDVSRNFKDSEAVNQALRKLVELEAKPTAKQGGTKAASIAFVREAKGRGYSAGKKNRTP